MAKTIKQREEDALLYARNNLSDLITAVDYATAVNEVLYFIPRFEDSLVSGTGLPFLIALDKGTYRITDTKEYESIISRLE